MRKKTIEDYVELIDVLQRKNKKVRTSEIAIALSINPASVTEIFQKLSEEGYITYKKYCGVSLTTKGKKLAETTKKKHESLKEFLLIIGIEQRIAEEDACEMEHILHQTSMNSIIKFVEVVKQCKFTPLLLNRLKEYIKTGHLSDCPAELGETCFKYAKKVAKSK